MPKMAPFIFQSYIYIFVYLRWRFCLAYKLEVALLRFSFYMNCTEWDPILKPYWNLLWLIWREPYIICIYSITCMYSQTLRVLFEERNTNNVMTKIENCRDWPRLQACYWTKWGPGTGEEDGERISHHSLWQENSYKAESWGLQPGGEQLQFHKRCYVK